MATKRIKKKSAKRKGLSGPRYWLTVGTLAAYTAGGGGKAALAQKTDRSKGLGNSNRIEALPVRRYLIPAGTMDAVIGAFEKISGLRVEFATPNLADIQSPGVTGTYTSEEALKKILDGRGIVYRFTGAKTVRLELPVATTSIAVSAEVPVVAESLSKFQLPLSETPQTITAVPQQVMAQQNTTTLRDVLRNVAGISLAAGEGGAQGDNLTIRGFTARNDLFIDGMRDFGSYYRDPFNTQEVEILQGPSSVTFGRGSTGGIVNQASKTPDLNRYLALDLDFGTDLTRRGTVDINTPVPRLGQGAAFRLNLMGDEGNVAGRDVAENRRDGFAPSLALGVGTPTRLTLSYFHQNEDDIPDYGIPWMFNGPAPVPHSSYYGLRDGNYLRTYDDIGTVKVEHDVNEKVTVRDQVRYANYVRDALITEPQLNGIKLWTPLDAVSVTRHEIAVNSTETFLDEQLDAIAHFQTGPIRHTFVSGIEAGRETSDPTRPNYTAPSTSLLDPNPNQSLNPNVTIASSVHDTALSAGAYAI